MVEVEVSEGRCQVRRLLVTGVGRPLPALLAAHLASTFPDAEVVGCDLSPFEPVDRHHCGTDVVADGRGYAFVRADTRNPSIATVLRDHQIDTVVHFGAPACGDAVFADAAPGPLAKELAVIGTMQLLAAASRHQPLRRLIVGSSAVVYPSTHRSPALADEKTVVTIRGTARMPDVLELESYTHQFADKRRDVDVSLLRLSDVAGPGLRGSLGRVLRRSIAPMVAGFDPRIQLLHVDDAVAAVAAVLTAGVTGTLNVAPDDVLLWSHLVRLAGRWPVPLPAVLVPEQLRSLLRFGNAVDNDKLRRSTGWAPKYRTREALDGWATASCNAGDAGRGVVSGG